MCEHNMNDILGCVFGAGPRMVEAFIIIRKEVNFCFG